jgi:methionine transaminase
MSQLAQDCDAINLSQGFPSFNPDPQLLALVDHHLQSGANQYAPMTGIPALREAIAGKVNRLYGRDADPDTEVTVCAGATEGLFSAITAIVRPGDNVIVFDPAYDSYEPVVTLAGGSTTHVSLATTPSGHFGIDWQRLQDALNDQTRLIILNFPHNPTGAILGSGDLDRLANVIRDRDLYLLSDEVYEHIIFDGYEHQSLLRHDELWERSFVLSSFGKTCHATGWKVGYCVAPAELSAEFRKVHQFNCFSVVTPMQHALADFMIDKPFHYQGLSEFYEKKRDYFTGLLEASALTFTPAQSTFFQVVDYSALSRDTDTDFAIQLTREIGVASIPVSVFCETPSTSRLLRLCFAKDDATLQEAANRLCKL